MIRAEYLQPISPDVRVSPVSARCSELRGYLAMAACHGAQDRHTLPVTRPVRITSGIVDHRSREWRQSVYRCQIAAIVDID
jgi:hypothetical protein